MAIRKIGIVGDSFWTSYGSGAYISTYLSTLMTANGDTVTVYNQAINGTTSADWVYTGTDWTTAKAAFPADMTDLIIALGINDSADGGSTGAPVSQATYQSNIQGIITNAKASFPSLARIWLIGPGYPLNGYGYFSTSSPARMVSYMAAQVALSKANAGVYAVAQECYYVLESTSAYRVSANDIHPNSVGDQWIAQAIFDAMQAVTNVGTGDSPGVTTLLSRVTSTRAGYLDNLTNLDAAISTRSTYAGGAVASVTAAVTVGGYSAGEDPASLMATAGYTTTRAAKLDNLDVAVSSRSTYAGGDTAGVTTLLARVPTFPANFASLAITVGGAVTAGTVNDKTGYALSSAGLDSIVIETGVNARQALSPILAACAGVVSGAGTNSITIQGGNVATTRITASTDSSGNRTSVTLSLPT